MLQYGFQFFVRKAAVRAYVLVFHIWNVLVSFGCIFIAVHVANVTISLMIHAPTVLAFHTFFTIEQVFKVKFKCVRDFGIERLPVRLLVCQNVVEKAGIVLVKSTFRAQINLTKQLLIR